MGVWLLGSVASAARAEMLAPPPFSSSCVHRDRAALLRLTQIFRRNTLDETLGEDFGATEKLRQPLALRQAGSALARGAQPRHPYPPLQPAQRLRQCQHQHQIEQGHHHEYLEVVKVAGGDALPHPHQVQ